MSTFITKPINVPLGKTDCYKQLIADKCALKLNQIKSVTLHKQSVDARDKSNVHFVCSFLIDVDKSFVRNAEPYVAPIDVLHNAKRNNNFFGKKIVVCGAGPAGLFCALYLSKLDFDVTVVEKGEDIAARKKSVDEFVCGGAFCPDSNIQFGLGGAGTFSDGKLTTGISSPLTYSVFRQFVRSGAPDDIFYSALPHIGTDKLVNVVAELRDEIIANGGKFLFGASLCGFVKEGESVVACRVFDGTSEPYKPTVLLWLRDTRHVTCSNFCVQSVQTWCPRLLQWDCAWSTLENLSTTPNTACLLLTEICPRLATSWCTTAQNIVVTVFACVPVVMSCLPTVRRTPSLSTA